MVRGKYLYELKMVNGIHGDAAVYLFLPTSGRALLFDLGQLSALSNKELLKARHAYISHTHIDHFIGFDQLLRVNIPHGKILTLCGPKGFIQNVEAKIKSYTWNLLEPGQMQFVVSEVHEDGSVLTAKLMNDNNFAPIIEQTKAPEQLHQPIALVERFNDHSEIWATALDHRTPSIAYRFVSPKRFQVATEVLERYGWQPGPWISALQAEANNGEVKGKLKLNGIEKDKADIVDELFVERPPFSITYITDLIFSAANLERIKKLAMDSSLVICEACFMARDRDRAASKRHLTTKQAALIAAMLQAENLELMHVSNIYCHETEAVIAEKELYFDDYKNMSADDLRNNIELELNEGLAFSCDQ